MLTTIHTSSRPLGNGLVLKSITDERDIERIGAFDVQIFGHGVAGFSPALIRHHPSTRPEYWLHVEDEATDQIVASLTLIPWEWRYEDVVLKAGEVGIVGTAAEYRNKGLIRALMARHRELLREGEFDLSHIQGIPYFYRQFGYEYAIPLETHWNVELRHITEQSSEQAALYHFRQATMQDIPAMMHLYADAANRLDISAVRSEAMWQYLLSYSVPTDTGAETWLVLDGDEQPIAYFRIPFLGFGDGLIVSESSNMERECGEAVLSFLKQEALKRSKPYIRLNLNDSSDLVQAAKGFNVRYEGTYRWQIHLVDVARLLRKLTPVLERRIAGSIFAGLTRTITLNLYREAFELCFEKGKLRSVTAIGFSDKGEIKMPPLLFAPLLLGSRSRAELSEMYPDIGIGGPFAPLVDVLFPRLDAFIYTIY